MKDFFISYNSADKAWAEWIAWQLEANGDTTILQAWDFSGSNFALEMDRALKNSERTILVLSPDFLTASFTQPEWAAVFVKDPTGEKRLLRPVRVRECKPDGLLAPIDYIDLVGFEEGVAQKKLIDELKKGRHKPKRKPTFPTTSSPPFPKVPWIWNVPIARNRNFTGREEQLKRLHDSLQSGKPTALTQAIRGMGGVGKTQIAAEYAYRHAGEYDVVWWVQSEVATKRASDFAGLAGKLGLKEAGARDLDITINAVREWLRVNDKWLLIFDNAERPEDISPYLPQSTLGHVLITSRHSAWIGTAEPLDIEIMPPDEAIAFLLKRTDSEDKETAAELAKELGYLPLALEQAGAYIEQTAGSLTGYLKLFRDNQTKIFGEDAAKPSMDYEQTILTTWTAALEKVQEQSPEAIELMNLCAFLAPDDIPKEMLIEGAKHLPETLAEAVKEPLLFNRALTALRNFSLIEARDDGLSIHRLLQAVIREQLTEDAQETLAEAAVEIVNGIFPGEVTTNIESWPICARLLPHAQASASEAEERKVAPEATSRLQNQAGVYLQGRAQFAEAKALYKRALKICEEAHGFEHPNVAATVSNLGEALREEGYLIEAKQCFERALKIDEKAYGPDHPNVATDVNNLGNVLRAQGDLAGAKRYFERALKSDEKAYGPDHPEVAIDVNNLGNVLREQGNLTGAKKCFERALKIDEKAYGPDHPSVAICVNNLGNVLYDTRDLAGAKECFERSLRINEKAYGPDHPSVAVRVNNLGMVLKEEGDLTKARKYFERAYLIRMAVFGKDHPDTVHSKKSLNSLPPEYIFRPG